MGTVLKALLQQRHLQTVAAFNEAYDRAARDTEPELVGAGPGKAQFYRWLSGNLTNLPYPHHCRVLEAMFPGWTVTELFAECADPAALPHPVTLSAAQFSTPLAGIEAVYTSRAGFLQAMPPSALFEEARRIDMVGLSLNLLCQHLCDTDLSRLLRSGSVLRCLFLDPDGNHIQEREREEGHTSTVLSNLTTLNMQSLSRVQRRAEAFAGAIQIRTYDEIPRFNITIIDGVRCVVQPYLPSARGVESPTFVARKSVEPGIFDTFAEIFEAMWSSAQEVTPG
ncbi:DUF5919 domain-containing protein [Nocardia wallacei]|uniref:DUF5919 domain-containing protein n=1 Tax=Nocardia wallacei TaxID=480035 RepID=UPI0024550E02|nr:DUF5919 domain-containing protein [Nocardia wallacei]